METIEHVQMELRALPADAYEKARSVGIYGPRNSGKTVAAISVLRAKTAFTKFDAILVFCDSHDSREKIQRAFPYAVMAPEMTYEAVKAAHPSNAKVAVLIDDWVERQHTACILPSANTFVVETFQYPTDKLLKTHDVVVGFVGKSDRDMPSHFVSLLPPCGITIDIVCEARLELRGHEALAWQRAADRQLFYFNAAYFPENKVSALLYEIEKTVAPQFVQGYHRIKTASGFVSPWYATRDVIGFWRHVLLSGGNTEFLKEFAEKTTDDQLYSILAGAPSAWFGVEHTDICPMITI